MIYVITFGFIVVDFISGILMAVKEKNFNSSKMRSGLVNKFGEVLICFVGVLIDFAQAYVDLGYNVPVAESICAYIIIMEIGSIVENIGSINNEIIPKGIQDIFSKLKRD